MEVSSSSVCLFHLYVSCYILSIDIFEIRISGYLVTVHFWELGKMLRISKKDLPQLYIHY